MLLDPFFNAIMMRSGTIFILEQSLPETSWILPPIKETCLDTDYFQQFLVPGYYSTYSLLSKVIQRRSCLNTSTNLQHTLDGAGAGKIVNGMA